MLELSGIAAGYGDMQVLRRIDLSLPTSEVVAVLGPNGAGKTTMLRVAAGLLQPWAGAVSLDGVDITAMPAHERAALGLCSVYGGRGVFRSLTVAENLDLFAIHGHGSVEQVIEEFPRLGERLHQVAGTMSGGEQQMLALARAYLQTPRVILLDEVSLGLAPKVIEEIFVVLRRMASAGISLLIVEQYVNLALDLANYVYILNRGGISFAGEPAELAGEDVFEHYVAAGFAT